MTPDFIATRAPQSTAHLQIIHKNLRVMLVSLRYGWDFLRFLFTDVLEFVSCTILNRSNCKTVTLILLTDWMTLILLHSWLLPDAMRRAIWPVIAASVTTVESLVTSLVNVSKPPKSLHLVHVAACVCFFGAFVACPMKTFTEFPRWKNITTQAH